MPESFPTFLSGRVTIVTVDITTQDIDAIVNAANSTLLGGGGVDGAIHRVGGPQILHECRRIRETTHPEGLPTGEAVITTGGNLPAGYVIHTVGPIYGHNPDREAELLGACYQNSLRLAVGNYRTTEDDVRRLDRFSVDFDRRVRISEAGSRRRLVPRHQGFPYC